MALWVLIGMLAAFGALCAVWVIWGWIQPDCGGLLRYCPERPEEVGIFVGRYLWLKHTGLIRCALEIECGELDEAEKHRLAERGIRTEPKPEYGIGAETN